MAFVFREEHERYPKSNTPGPSYYQPEGNKTLKPLSVPFNQSSPRKIWQKNTIPGPGSYHSNADSSKSKLFIQQNGKLLLMNRKSESFNFKSACDRFKVVENKLPAPGQYETTPFYSSSQAVKKPKENTSNNKNNLQKYLLMTHSQKLEEKLVKLQIILEKQTHLKSLPNYEKVEAQKKAVPFNSSVQRTIIHRPQTSLGPGSYDIPNLSKHKQLTIKIKPSYSLAKLKKALVTQEEVKQPLITQQKLCLHKKQTSFQPEVSKNNSLKKKKEDFFGSSVGRFCKTQSENIPGPGSYQVIKADPKCMKKEKSKVAFGSVASPEKPSYQSVPSPFVVETQETIKNEKKRNSKTNKNLNFGSKQPRFKQKSMDQRDSKPKNLNLNICLGSFKPHNKQNVKSRLKLKKPSINKSKRQIVYPVDERPLCYAPQLHTIADRLGQRHQVNAPFNTQVARFADIDKEKNIIENLIAEIQRVQQKQDRRFQERPQPKGLMDSNNPRFDYKVPDSHTSPCSYDPSKPIKKEFNILFL